MTSQVEAERTSEVRQLLRHLCASRLWQLPGRAAGGAVAGWPWLGGEGDGTCRTNGENGHLNVSY